MSYYPPPQGQGGYGYQQPPPAGSGYYQPQYPNTPQQQQPQHPYATQPPYQAVQGQYSNQHPPTNQYGSAPPAAPYANYPQQTQPNPPYGAPAPAPSPYGAPPGGYQPPGQVQPQYNMPPPGQQPPYGAYPPPNQSAYSAPPQGYGTPQASYGPPTPASPGYGPPQHIAWDATIDADGLRKAMKGFGTDEKALISILTRKDVHQIALIRQVYHQRHHRTLEADIASETSGHLEDGLLALVRGPLQQDVYLLRKATNGPGTKEAVLNDVLLARSNADIAAIKGAYQHTYHQSLESVLRSDLSMKTERHFMMVLAGNRAEDSAPVIPQQVDQDVLELYKATEGKVGTDELLVCSILTSRNDAQIRAIAHAYQARFSRDLETVVKKEFSGHMENALLCQLRAGRDRIMRDAMLLEDAMVGVGTKDLLLINRVVRFHWDNNHMNQIKGAYRQRYGRDLVSRIKGETSGDYEKLLVACVEG